MPLTFTEKGHKYALDGHHVPSVTTIVDTLPKGGLVPWAAGLVAETVAKQPSSVDALRAMGYGPLVAALRAVPDEARRRAGDRGTLIHELATGVVKGEPSGLMTDPDIAECIEGLARWFDDVQFVPLLIERPVANRLYQYAGRFDVIGTMGDRRDEVCLLDLKSSKHVYGDTALQLAGYALAEFYVSEDGDELPLPRIDRIGVVHVQPGISELYDLGDIDEGFDEFLAARTLYLTTHRRRDLVRAPVPADVQQAAVL